MKKILFVLMLLVVVNGVKAVEFREADIDDYRIVYRSNEKVIDKMLFDGSKPVFMLNIYGNEVNLNEKQKEDINLIIYYHYGKAPTAQRYAETQVLIFMYLDNLKSYYLYDKNNNSISIHYTTYNSIIEQHTKVPSFNGMSYEVGLNETLSIPDYNGSVLNYATDEVDGLVIAKYYASMEVTARKLGNYTIEFKKESTNLDDIQVYDNKYIALGKFDPLSAKVDIVVPSIEVEFDLKYDDDLAWYNIYDGDGNLLLQAKLKDEVNFKIKDVDKVIIQEISHSDIYENNPNVYEFDTTINKKVVVSYEAEYKKYELQINSCLFSKRNELCIKGVEKNGVILDKEGNLVEEFKTDDDGKYEISLKIGNYIVEIDKEKYLVNLDKDQVIWYEIYALEEIEYEKDIKKIYDMMGKEREFEIVNGKYIFDDYLEEGSYYLINEFDERINFEVISGISRLVIDDTYEVIKPSYDEDDKILDEEILIEVPNTSKEGIVIYVDDNKKRYISFGSSFMFVVGT